MKAKHIFSKSIALLLVSSTLLSGCENPFMTKNQEEVPTIDSTEQAKPSKSYTADMFQVDDTSFIKTTLVTSSDIDSTNNAMVNSSLTFPTVSIEERPEVADIINETLKYYKDAYNQTLKTYQEDAAQKRMDDPDNFEAFAYFLDFKVERNDESIYSLTRSEYVSNDKTDHQQITTTANFDSKTGILLTLSDITEDVQGLLTVLKQQIIVQANSGYYIDRFKLKPDSKAFAKQIDDILTDDYWYFDNRGINIIANGFSIGDVNGASNTFTIPYAYINEYLKPDYQYEGAFVFPTGYGCVAMNYLNDDEELDAICLTCDLAEDGETYTPFIAINGVDYSKALKDANFESFECITPYYYLIDLDENDSFVEFAICDYGFNDYHQTYVFRYTGKKVEYLGSFSDLPENSVIFDRSGSLTCHTRLQMLETKSALASYELKDDKLVLKDQEWYYPENTLIDETFKKHDVLFQFVVYCDKDTSSEKYTLKRADGPIQILAVDEKEWAVIKTAEDKIYFVHMTSNLEIDSDGESVDAQELLDSLLLAG